MELWGVFVELRKREHIIGGDSAITKNPSGLDWDVI
jgi:hypothetical protein